MKKIVISLIATISIFLTVGCGSKGNALVGTWNGDTNDGLNTTFIFKKGDKVEYNNEYGIKSSGTYKIEDNKVTITLESWDKAKVYEFTINDNNLSLKATDVYSPSYDKLTKK